MTPKEIRYKKHLKKERKTRIWLIIRRLVIRNDVLNGYSIHEYLDYKVERNRLDALIKETSVSKREKEIACRFVKHAISTGHCDSNLNEIALSAYDEWINDSEILRRIYVNFKIYWDNVIRSYKSSNAKSKRITYIIEKLNEDIVRSEICQIVSIQAQIRDLIEYFKNMECTR